MTPDQKVNAFKPKDLTASDDKQQLRSAMFGSIFSGSYNTMPSAEHAKVVWEALDKTIQNTCTSGIIPIFLAYLSGSP